MVQGVVDRADTTLQARRIIRLDKPAPLAAGISLAAVPMQPMATPGPVMSGGGPATDLVGVPAVVPLAPGAPVPGQTSVGDRNALPALKGNKKELKVEEKIRKAVDQAIKRGVLTGRVVTSNPLTVEIYDGRIWTVSPNAGCLSLDQERAAASDLRDGSWVMVRGSEVGVLQCRASQVDILPAGLSLGDARPGQGAGRGRRPIPVRPAVQVRAMPRQELPELAPQWRGERCGACPSQSRQRQQPSRGAWKSGRGLPAPTRERHRGARWRRGSPRIP